MTRQKTVAVETVQDWADDRWATHRCSTMPTVGRAGACDNVPTFRVERQAEGGTLTAYYCDLHCPEEHYR